jgi:hypothetical protein
MALSEQSKENDDIAEGAEVETLRGLRSSEGWLWILENWKVWKAAFRKITERVDGVRVHGAVRSEASKALKGMKELDVF